MKKIIVYGINDFAKLLSLYLEEQYEIVCYTIEEKFLTIDSFLGKPVVAFEKIETFFNVSEYSFFVAIGYSQVNKLRERILNDVKAKNYSLVSYVHPSCVISKNVEIKDNIFIFENVVVQPFSKLEENLIIWSNATICHDSIVEKNCFIGSNACINGFCKIGNNSFIGSNSTIRNGITIGKYNVVGAGCTVLSNTDDFKVCKCNNLQFIEVSPEDLRI